MVSPSRSGCSTTIALRSSLLFGFMGEIETEGAGGGVLTSRVCVWIVLRPSESVAVMVMLCVPALNEEYPKATIPYESAPCVEKTPSRSDFQEKEISEGISS